MAMIVCTILSEWKQEKIAEMLKMIGETGDDRIMVQHSIIS